MAARNRRIHVDPATRERIAVSQIVNRLNMAALGKVEMDSNQIAAARILLDKSMPSLAQIEAHNTNVVQTVAAEPMSEAEWAAQHGAENNPAPATIIPVDNASTPVISSVNRNGGTIQ